MLGWCGGRLSGVDLQVGTCMGIMFMWFSILFEGLRLG